MFALFSRILKLSGRYKSRIQGAFVCAFLESILSKMPIFLAFVVLSGFANKTITGQTCLYVGLGLAAIVLVQMLVHYLSDSLQSAAGYLMFADKRIELGGHLRKLPMGYFTSGNIGKISSVLSTDMVFIEEVAMSTLGNMMSYRLSSLVLLAFMFYLNWQLGLIAAIVTILAWLVSKGMNKVSLREAAGRQEQSERLTDAVLSFVEGIGVIKSYNLLGEKSEELSGNFKRSRNTSLDFERKMTPWTMGLNILYGIGIAAIFGLSIVLEQSGTSSLLCISWKKELIYAGADCVMDINSTTEEVDLQIFSLARRNNKQKITQKQSETMIDKGKLVMDHKKHKVFWNDVALHLTRQEYNFLYLLAATPMRVYTFEQIYQLVWKDYPVGDIKNIIWCLVKRLRKKLNVVEDGAGNCIVSVRDIGYKFELNKENEQQ